MSIPGDKRPFLLLALALMVAGIAWQLFPANAAGPRQVRARGSLTEEETSTIGIFERTSPAVVFITTRQQVINPWTRNVRSIPKGTGSGFIWDEAGHVVTNHHVIADSSDAKVRLNDGRSYDATLVGSSPSHDLAVLRIRVPFNRPPPVPIGTSGDLKVGQKVLAIGNPFGLDYTLTSGLVSALDRSLSEENGATIDHLIQTDAAINPGNSGGPLLDSAGRLIGINTAIYSPSGAYAGIGFAVPVDTVNRVVPEIIAKGRYVRPSLGIVIDEDANRLMNKELRMAGVWVLGVERNSLATRIGLQPAHVDDQGNVVAGDMIQAIGGKPVKSVGELLSRLDDFRTGDRTRLTIWREGHEQTFDVQF